MGQERKREEEEEAMSDTVKHMGPGGGQTWVQILGPLFPNCVTWPYFLISLGLGFIIYEMGMVIPHP